MISDKLSELIQEDENNAADEEEQLKKLISDHYGKNFDDLSYEEVMEVYKELNPYGPVLGDEQENKKTCSFSYTNYRMDFARQYNMTGLIGFLFRMVMEHKVPEGIPTVDLDEYQENPSIANAPENIKDEKTLKMYQEFHDTMEERVFIHNFLKKWFKYNPDEHVRSSYRSNKEDPSRRKINTENAKLATNKKNSIKKVSKKDYEAKAEELDYTPNEDEKHMLENTPPHDTHVRLQRYMNEHHEVIQQCVKDIYDNSPDLDIAINIYGEFPSQAEADKFKQENMSQVIAGVHNVNSNRWALLGPYQENRERVDFYNKHTEVLKAMLDRRAEDEPTAVDIMKKHIKKKKKQNIKEAGPDSKVFKKWIKQNKPDIDKMGGEHVNVSDNEDECGDDEVEVNVFTLNDGGRDMKIHKIYNKAEKPPEEKKETKRRLTPSELNAGVENAANVTVAEFN